MLHLSYAVRMAWNPAAVLVLYAAFVAGCSQREYRTVDQDRPTDTRVAVELSASAQTEHRAVMLQHLESVQMIVNALVEANYELAKGLTESHLGFFRHREVMARQQPENFPPAYHDLAMAHHEAAEQLAGIIPTKDLKQIMPKFNDLLKACVACHREYRVETSEASFLKRPSITFGMVSHEPERGE